jgi:hypothetical protein
MAANGDLAALSSRVAERQPQEPSSPPQSDDKAKRILTACRDNDLNALIELATSAGGLVDDEIRQTACKTSQLLAPRPLHLYCPQLAG